MVNADKGMRRGNEFNFNINDRAQHRVNVISSINEPTISDNFGLINDG